MILSVVGVMSLATANVFAQEPEAAATEEVVAAEEEVATEEAAPAIQNQAASTTLGDIDALAALKSKLEGNAE